MIDNTDKKILFALDQNCREPLLRLAKRLRINKDTLAYRIKRMRDSGIIRAEQAVIDAGRLGTLGFRLLLRLTAIAPEQEQQLIDYLTQSPNVRWVVSVEGLWDINTYLTAATISEIHLFEQQLVERFGEHIAARQLSVFIRLTIFSRVQGEGQERKAITGFSQGPLVVVDTNDNIILEALATDSRTTILALAQKTGLSAKTVLERIRRLEREGVITGYRVTLNLENANLLYYKLHLTLIKPVPANINRIREYLRQSPEIIYEDELLGGWDLEFEAQVPDAQALRDLIQKLRANYGAEIRDIEILHYYKEHKLGFL